MSRRLRCLPVWNGSLVFARRLHPWHSSGQPFCRHFLDLGFPDTFCDYIQVLFLGQACLVWRGFEFINVKPQGQRQFVCVGPQPRFLVFYLVLVLCSLRWRRLGRTKDRSTCWYEGAPGLSPAPKLSNVFTVWGPSWSQQVGSWRREKQAAQVHPPWLPHPPQSQPIGKSKIF